MTLLLTRVLARTAADPAGCLLWTGQTDRYGYGKVGLKGRHVKPHRLVYEELVAPLAPGLVIDHLCRNRLCLNVLHLEAVTPEENTRRGRLWREAQTHCVRGHAFAESGYRRSDGYRGCRACTTENQRARKNYSNA